MYCLMRERLVCHTDTQTQAGSRKKPPSHPCISSLRLNQPAPLCSILLYLYERGLHPFSPQREAGRRSCAPQVFSQGFRSFDLPVQYFICTTYTTAQPPHSLPNTRENPGSESGVGHSEHSDVYTSILVVYLNELLQLLLGLPCLKCCSCMCFWHSC